MFARTKIQKFVVIVAVLVTVAFVCVGCEGSRVDQPTEASESSESKSKFNLYEFSIVITDEDGKVIVVDAWEPDVWQFGINAELTFAFAPVLNNDNILQVDDLAFFKSPRVAFGYEASSSVGVVFVLKSGVVVIVPTSGDPFAVVDSGSGVPELKTVVSVNADEENQNQLISNLANVKVYLPSIAEQSNAYEQDDPY